MRKPGSAWVELPRPATAGAEPTGYVRIGYARASTVRQSLDTQLDSLRDAGVTKVFAEKISTRVLRRPELDKAVALAQEIRASGVAVTLVVHEHKRLGRGIEQAMLAEQLRAADIGLEFLTGELHGCHDPSGIVFTVLAAMSGMDREYIRDRTLEGHESARARGKAIGGATVTDPGMLSHALHLRDQQGLSLREIAGQLVISRGKKKAEHPSPATVLRMFRDHGHASQAAQTSAPASEPATASSEWLLASLRPVRARIWRPGEPLTTQDRDPRERLVRQREARSEATCPTCGNQPVEARARWQQRQDLAVVWLYADPDHPGDVLEQRHCAECQPHQRCQTLSCSLCGDGPMIAGELAEAMPDERTPPSPCRLTGLWYAE